MAKVTGLTEDQITGQLREGKSLTPIAAPKGKTHADLKAAILANAKPKLDAQITAGRVTRGQADREYQGIEQRLDHLLTAKRPAPAQPVFAPSGTAASRTSSVGSDPEKNHVLLGISDGRGPAQPVGAALPGDGRARAATA